MADLREAFLIDAVRTPMGRYAGVLSGVRPDDLAARVIAALIERNVVLPEAVDDVQWGAANQAGEDNRNVARMALLMAGLPVTVPGATVNRLCGSGLEAINNGYRQIKAGEADVVIAGGSESMTRAPFVMGKATTPFDRSAEVFDTTLGWRFLNPRFEEGWGSHRMGETAEIVAREYEIDRGARDEGRFKDQIIPIEVPQKKGDPVTVDVDEPPRPDASLESLGRLRPAFEEGGTVTAGNSSGLNDGAAAVLLASAEAVSANGWRPKVRIITSAVAGVEPRVMGIGPIFATRKALQRAQLSVEDIDLVELNEAFAAQSLACIRELGLDAAKVNVNGGAIALGHPLGCSGARILTSLVHEMHRRESRVGLATMCIGVGQGIATIVESV
jgi:3-oxoadipyl-CoA thiolase